jgi:D-hexose-6-phosphate mutarotase
MVLRSSLPILALALSTTWRLAAQQPGLPTDWDVQKLVQDVAAQSARLQPLVDQIRPKEWPAGGASAAYSQQWDSAHSQAQAVRISADNLVRQPERLSAALDTYFRLQNLEVVLTSLVEGVRKYQNPALGDLLRSLMNENSASRQQLRQYIVDLATTKEQEFNVMDQEAQRCREIVSKPAPVPPPRKKPGN